MYLYMSRHGSIRSLRQSYFFTESNLNPVFLSSNFERVDNEEYLIKWEQAGDLSQLSHYRVYRKTSNDTISTSYYTTSTQITIQDDENDALVANENLIVAAFSKTDEPNGLSGIFTSHQ